MLCIRFRNRLFSALALIASAPWCGSIHAQDSDTDDVIQFSHSFVPIEIPNDQPVNVSWHLSANNRCSSCHQAGASDFAFSNRLLIPNSQDGFVLGQYRVSLLQDPILRSHLRLGEKPALLILSESAEDEKQLKRGDIVLTINEVDVDALGEIQAQVDADQSGDIDIHIVREGEELELTINAIEIARPPKPYRIGVQVEPPSDALRSQLRLYNNEGLLVTAVVDESAAAQAGIEEHDILLRIADQRLSDLDGLRLAVNQSEGSEVEVRLMRAGKEMSVDVTPQQQAEPEGGSIENCPAAGRWFETNGITIDVPAFEPAQ